MPNRDTNPSPRATRAAALVLLCAGLATPLGLSHAAPAEGEVSTESVVIFNTICAKCHEAQCSGRLSFDTGYEAAVRHILRHYGRAEGRVPLQKELFAVLDHMKQDCAYYPMAGTIPPARVWDAELLARYGTLQEHDYFVPLGRFEAGEYQLDFDLAAPVQINLELIDESFEMVLDECLNPQDRSVTVPFTVEQPGRLYFRLYTGSPTPLEGLTVKERR